MPRSVWRWALCDALHCTTSGFKPRALNSSRSNVRANQPRSSPSSSGSISHTPDRGVSWKIMLPSHPPGGGSEPGGDSREQCQLRRARSEASAPLADEAELLDDLVLQVPRQDQHHIWSVLAQSLRRADRNVRARQEVALLVRVQVACVVDEIAADAAVVEQCVALRRGAVAGDPQTLALELDQEAEDLALVLLDATVVGQVCVDPLVAGLALALAQLGGSSAFWLLRVSCVAAVDTQRTAMGGQLFHVEQAQAMRLEHTTDGQK